MMVGGDTLVLSAGTFLLGLVAKDAISYFVRRIEKRDNELDRHKALAYTHTVQLTEFVVTDLSFKRILKPLLPGLLAMADGDSLEHSFAVMWAGHIKEMTEEERSAQVGLIKPLVGLIDSYTEYFQLPPEKLADLPRNVIYQYNVHQIEARRLSTALGGLLEHIENRVPHVNAEMIAQLIAAYKAHHNAGTDLHASFIAIAGIDEVEQQALIERSRKRQFDQIEGHERDVAILHAIQAKITPSTPKAA